MPPSSSVLFPCFKHTSFSSVAFSWGLSRIARRSCFSFDIRMLIRLCSTVQDLKGCQLRHPKACLSAFTLVSVASEGSCTVASMASLMSNVDQFPENNKHSSQRMTSQGRYILISFYFHLFFLNLEDYPLRKVLMPFYSLLYIQICIG